MFIGLVFAFIAGIAIGYWISYHLVKHQPSIDQTAYTELKTENEAFRAKVNEHFDQSSEMFRSITEQYVALYNHMSESATDLYDENNTSAPKLDHIEVRAAETAPEKPES